MSGAGPIARRGRRQIGPPASSVEIYQTIGDPARIWWLNPTWLLLLIILPIFGTAIVLASPIMAKFGVHNFLTAKPIMLALAGMLALGLGSLCGEQMSAGWRSSRVIVSDRVLWAIAIMAGVSIAAHLVFLGAILSKPAVIIQVLAGQRGAIYVAKALANQIPGVTSFTQLFLLALPLYGALPYIMRREPPVWLRNMIVVLLVLLVARAIFTAERFTIVEAAVALIVPRIAFARRIPPYAKLLPLFGFVAMIALFSLGEFTRSWAYNRFAYSSFAEFAYVRLLGYLATATNNGAGLLEVYGPINAPLYTAGWFHKLPLWDFMDNPLKVDNPLTLFFASYGNSEFNNPSGLLSPILDYGVCGGLILHFVFGLLGGVSFSMLRKGNLLAIMIFPVMFLGFMIINQAYYWTNARIFIPVVLSFVVAFVVTSPLVRRVR